MDAQEYMEQESRLRRFDRLNDRLRELQEIKKSFDFENKPNRRTINKLIVSYEKEVEIPYEYKDEICDAVAQVVTKIMDQIRKEIDEI